MPSPKRKKELQAFLSVLNYLGKFSLGTAEVCESLRKLTSAQAEWKWSTTNQKTFEEAKNIIKEDVCIKFNDGTVTHMKFREIPGNCLV